MDEMMAIKPPRILIADLDRICDQIKNALDGRSQRWLSLKTQIPESDLSKKMTNKVPFTLADLKSISAALDVEFVLSPDQTMTGNIEDV